jgi:RNA polymerase sigma-70 factor (family 1)
MNDREHLYQHFKAAFHAYYAPLCQYAGTFTGDPHDAEDIVQETFLKIWEKKEGLIGTRELKYYLYIAVRNNCLTRLNDKKKLPLTPLNDDLSPAIDEESRAEDHPDISTVVHHALQKLPPKCREVFLLSRISRFSYQKIADTLGISVKTVDNQMGKAIRILRAYAKENRIKGHVIILFILINLVAT